MSTKKVLPVAANKLPAHFITADKEVMQVLANVIKLAQFYGAVGYYDFDSSELLAMRRASELLPEPTKLVREITS